MSARRLSSRLAVAAVREGAVQDSIYIKREGKLLVSSQSRSDYNLGSLQIITILISLLPYLAIF